jgi:ABC-type phosphate/phosphonate transport system substrate-binding protein
LGCAACSTGSAGAVPEQAQARRQFQWKPIAGYLNAGTGDQRVYLKIA